MVMIDFDSIEEKILPHFKDGRGEMRSAAYIDGANRLMRNTLAPGHSIGLHKHEANAEIIYVLQEAAKTIIDGKEERLATGLVHYCPNGHTHSIINDGGCDLVFLAFVIAR